MTAELHIGLQGEPLAAQFYPAVINSHARLTYTRVAACLDADERTDLAAELVSQLQQMAELARILSRMRTERGSLNLDIDEVEILVDAQGRPVELVKVERTIAHRLVEEFMLAANEAVARFLGGGGWPLLYRVHEVPDPDKLEELQQLAASCGHGLLLGSRLHKSMQVLLNSVAGRPEGRLINQQLLRSLQQAIYTPHNVGHFGLAAEDYCHFTSPIRRYPDLVVHRVLKLAVSGQPKSCAAGIDQLEILGSECSAKERRAMEAERDLLDLRRCQLMLERVGDEFGGIISAVVEFGFFVELDDLLVEGLVHMRTMQEDFYHFDPALLTLTGERQRRQYRVGMPVRVKLDRVDLPRRRIDFVLAESPARSGRKRSSGRAQKS
jgi:ribonuclease R